MSHRAQDSAASPGRRGPNGAVTGVRADADERARVVLDASGGDAPLAERMAGAIEAARLYGDTDLFLCGDRSDMERETAALPDNVHLVDAPEHISMHESPVQAVREKRRSSIVVGLRMVADQQADAFVSAGNTGAVAAASTLMLGRLEGVQRPGIAAAMRFIDHTVVAIDVGANMDCKPLHLLQYGIMASVFAGEVLGVENPRVGLLNVGEEATKGNDLVKQTFELLSAADINFVGNVEPEKLCSDGCDVVVCDGFVGNVMLKLGEGLVTRLIGWMREQVPRRLRYRIGFGLCKDLFRHLKSCGDYTEYGGALLLGIRGVTIITHGTSDAQGIQNAIREARAFVKSHVNQHIEDAIRRNAADRRAGVQPDAAPVTRGSGPNPQ